MGLGQAHSPGVVRIILNNPYLFIFIDSERQSREHAHTKGSNWLRTIFVPSQFNEFNTGESAAVFYFLSTAQPAICSARGRGFNQLNWLR
jgi:hypothetical protein